MGAACLLTSLTTVIGFLSLNLAAMPVLRSFGTYAAVGIGLAYLSVLFVLPIGLSFSRAAAPPAGEAGSGRVLRAATRFSLRWPRALVAAGLGLGAVCLFLAAQVVVDNQLTGSLPPDHPVYLANTQVDRELGGVLATELALEAAPGRLVESEVLEVMLQVGEDLGAIEEVRAVWSPAASLAAATEVGGGGYRIPPEAGIRSLLARLPMDTVLSPERDRARIVVRTQDVGANGFLEVARRIDEVARPRLEALGLVVEVTGTPVVAYDGINNVTADLRRSLSGAFLVITGLIFVLFRSWRLALVSVLPNGLPLLIGYGLLAVLDKPLDPAPAVIFTIALGIAVVDTLHFLTWFRREIAAGSEPPEAIRRCYRHCATAMLQTSVICGVGMLAFVFSSFVPASRFAWMVFVLLMTALFADLVILPALLAGPLGRVFVAKRSAVVSDSR